MNTIKKGHCEHPDCRYYGTLTDTCSYALAKGISRTKLHEGENVDINNPCREYEPRPEVRKRVWNG